jgi:uncharacterized protein YPO0396
MAFPLIGLLGGSKILGAVLQGIGKLLPKSDLMNSLSNGLVKALGSAIKQGVDTLVKQFGMPKFLGELLKKAVDHAVTEHTKPSSAEADQAVEHHCGSEIKNWANDLVKDLVDKTLEKLKSDSAGGKDCKKAGGKATASSWLSAISAAMADAITAKAHKMIDLSNQIKELSEKKIDQKDQNAVKQNAGEITAANADMNAASKEFDLLSNTLKNMVDTIGRATAEVAKR